MINSKSYNKQKILMKVFVFTANKIKNNNYIILDMSD